MPESAIHTAATTIADAICACIGELDLENCGECFLRENLCGECPPSIGWCGGPESNCSGMFVNFVGSTAEPSPTSNCFFINTMNFEVGVMLCVPNERNVIHPEFEAHQEFAECAMFLAGEVFKCLSALVCTCLTLDITEIGGIECRPDGFMIPVSVRV